MRKLWQWMVVCALVVMGAGMVMGQAAPSTQTGASKPQTVSEKIAASRELLDINTATAAELKALPGIGDNYVKRIVAARPYTVKSQLVSRGVLPQATYDGIKDKVIAHRPKK